MVGESVIIMGDFLEVMMTIVSHESPENHLEASQMQRKEGGSMERSQND